MKTFIKENWQFLISVSLAFIVCLLLCGCGTRKTDLFQFETKTDNITIENSYSMGSKIIMANNYTFRPFDNSKPFYIDGQKYENVDITVNKDVTAEKTITINTKYNIIKTITIEKKKTIDRTNYIYLWLGIVLIIVVAIFAWFYLPKLKT